MYQGNWKCSGCGGTITELPFEPRSEAGLTCRDCYFKDKGGGSSSGNADTSAQTDMAASSDMDDREVPPFDPDEMAPASEPAPEDPSMAAAPAASSDRKMFQGNWKCSQCDGEITELPFMPRSESGLTCRECYKKNKG